MIINESNVFFIDSIGALLSACIIGIIFPIYTQLIGLPNHIYYTLAVIALSIFTYSTFIIQNIRNKSFYTSLLSLAVLNGLYCLLTIGIVVRFWGRLSNIAVYYFVGELTLIILLIYMEVKLSERSNKRAKLKP